MKLSYIYECNVRDIQIDEGFRDKLKMAALGAGLAAGGILGGQAMLEPSSQQQQQQQTQSQEQQVQDGVTVEGDTIIVRTSDRLRVKSQRKANYMLAKHLKTNKLPVGVQDSSVKGKDGLWHTTLKLSKSSQAQGKKTAAEMGSSSIIQPYDGGQQQKTRSVDGRIAPLRGGSLSPDDL